jgi:RNA polymerase sigma-70 factor, ECF subfamily
MEQEIDHQVVAAVLAGDTEAYAILVQRYQKPIYNMMYRMTGSCEDALDLAQETFIKAFEALHQFRQGSRFFPWLYSIGLNHSRNFLRRKKAQQTVCIDDCDVGSGLDYPGQQEENLCALLDSQEIRNALDRLPVDYREALVLRYHEELSMEEIAAALEISLSGAKMRVHRGLGKLRKILENACNEEGKGHI